MAHELWKKPLNYLGNMDHNGSRYFTVEVGYGSVGHHHTLHGRICVTQHWFHSNNFVTSAILAEV